MKRTLVIPDIHGDYEVLKSLLAQCGIYDPDTDERIASDVFVVSLGDLVHADRNRVSGDLKCLTEVGRLVDRLIVGNHEHPYFGGNQFFGFYRDQAAANLLRGLKKNGFLVAGHAVNGVLVTHAGLGKRFAWLENAEEAAEYLNERWMDDPLAPVFDDIGHARGGNAPSGGGAIWADWSEKKCENFEQLVGHTIGDDVRRRGNATCIDLGPGRINSGRAAVAWFEEDGSWYVEKFQTPRQLERPLNNLWFADETDDDEDDEWGEDWEYEDDLTPRRRAALNWLRNKIN